MGRVANPLTPTQEDDELFAEFRNKIRKIGVRKLSSYGLISHETIYNYCKREPVSEQMEGLIIESIKKHKKALSQLAEPTKTAVREVLAMG